MSVQTKYTYKTGRGLPGGIYDMYHYPVDSRFNEEKNGVACKTYFRAGA